MPISKIFPINRRRLFQTPGSEVLAGSVAGQGTPVTAQVLNGSLLKRKRACGDTARDLPGSKIENQASESQVICGKQGGLERAAWHGVPPAEEEFLSTSQIKLGKETKKDTHGGEMHCLNMESEENGAISPILKANSMNKSSSLLSPNFKKQRQSYQKLHWECSVQQQDSGGLHAQKSKDWKVLSSYECQRLPCIPSTVLPAWDDVGIDVEMPTANFVLGRVPLLPVKMEKNISLHSLASSEPPVPQLQDGMGPRTRKVILDHNHLPHSIILPLMFCKSEDFPRGEEHPLECISAYSKNSCFTKDACSFLSSEHKTQENNAVIPDSASSPQKHELEEVLEDFEKQKQEVARAAQFFCFPTDFLKMFCS